MKQRDKSFYIFVKSILSILSISLLSFFSFNSYAEDFYGEIDNLFTEQEFRSLVNPQKASIAIKHIADLEAEVCETITKDSEALRISNLVLTKIVDNPIEICVNRKIETVLPKDQKEQQELEEIIYRYTLVSLWGQLTNLEKLEVMNNPECTNSYKLSGMQINGLSTFWNNEKESSAPPKKLKQGELFQKICARKIPAYTLLKNFKSEHLKDFASLLAVYKKDKETALKIICTFMNSNISIRKKVLPLDLGEVSEKDLISLASSIKRSNAFSTGKGGSEILRLNNETTLTQEEKDSIVYYTGKYHSYINGYVKQNHLGSIAAWAGSYFSENQEAGNFPHDIEAKAKNLERAMKKLTPLKAVVFHGRKEKIADIKPGEKYQLDGYLSSSLDRKVASKFSYNKEDKQLVMFVILSKTGKPIMNQSEFGLSQKEVLFAPGASLVLLKAEEKVRENGFTVYSYYFVEE